MTVPPRGFLMAAAVKKIFAACQDGRYSKQQIAEKYGVRRETVQTIATGRHWGGLTGKKWRPSGRNTPRPVFRVTAQLRRGIEARRKSGMSCRQIAEELGVPRNPLTKFVKKVETSRKEE